MHQRYYSPVLGRFVSVDPVAGRAANSQSWNRYSYVENSPLHFVDLDGCLKLRAELIGKVDSESPYSIEVIFETKAYVVGEAGSRVFEQMTSVGKWASRGRKAAEIVRSGWVDNHSETASIDPVRKTWSRAGFEGALLAEFKSLGAHQQGGAIDVPGASGIYKVETLSLLDKVVENVTKQLLLEGKISLSQRAELLKAYAITPLIQRAVDASKDTNPGVDDEREED